MNTIVYDTIQYITMQYNTIQKTQYNTIQYSYTNITAQYKTRVGVRKELKNDLHAHSLFRLSLTVSDSTIKW